MIQTLRTLEQEHRYATPAEQEVLSAWSGWGAVPEVFDNTISQWANERTELQQLFTKTEYQAARRSTMNAHYTDPSIVAAIWDGLKSAGFNGGKVLEPGCGSGTFIGLAGETVEATGIELDPVTAQVAAALYPTANIHAEGFEETLIEEDTFDAVVGNVPFGNFSLYDPKHNPTGFNIHNHFIVKSLDAVRPGGMVALITSAYTMDSRNTEARQAMHDRADLVAAIRLPNGAHQRTAGTDVLTDVLVFRKPLPGEQRPIFDWEHSQELTPESSLSMNNYFHLHPEQLLGKLGTTKSQYGIPRLAVHAEEHTEIGSALNHLLRTNMAQAVEQGRGFSEPLPANQIENEPDPRPTTDKESDLLIQHEGKWWLSNRGRLDQLNVPATQTKELAALVTMRTMARELLTLEHSTKEDTPQMDSLRAALKNTYLEYVNNYGPINRYTLYSTGKLVAEVNNLTGEALRDENGDPVLVPGTAKRKPEVMKFFKKDRYFALVIGLERFDEQTQTGKPSTLMEQRALHPREEITRVDTPEDAIMACLAQKGYVDMTRISQLLNLPNLQATREALTGLVFEDPVSGEFCTRADYLSGNVRIKLDQARAAHRTNPTQWETNVTALEQVQPARLGMEEITAKIGAAWIPDTIHNQFCCEIMRDNRIKIRHAADGWHINDWAQNSVECTRIWGTEKASARKLFEALLKGSEIKVTNQIPNPDGSKKDVVDEAATDTALQKAESMQEYFGQWIWQDPHRAEYLLEEYNRRFNSIVLRNYQQEGDALSFPGLVEKIKPYPHQRAAVARMLHEPTVGLFHEVGAGKTLEMVLGVMEMRRLQMVRKPLVVVPNHMLEQFSREWLEAYPTANLLVAGSDDVGKKGLPRFVARASLNDWDAIIITQQAFQNINVTPGAKAAYIEQKLDTARELLERLRQATQDQKFSVKENEKNLAQYAKKLQSQLDQKTVDVPGLAFENLGVDYLVVDEAHMYKNLGYHSSMGSGKNTADRARDLDLKLSILRKQYGQKVATFATATPIANSVAEAWVMTHFLRPDLLESAGIDQFDDWAATFGDQVTQLEISAGSGKIAAVRRFARFQNVPEMLKLWHTFADVKTAEQLNLPGIPNIAARASDGELKPEIEVIKPTIEQQAYFKLLADRAKRASRIDPHVDNMLKITSDGTKSALDIRLIDPRIIPSGEQKLDRVAQRCWEEYERTKNNQYQVSADDEELSTIPGGLQLVFMDLGVPKRGVTQQESWSSYRELARLLIEKGMPEEKIRFIHEARTDAEKATLFKQARDGHIAVLIGSTERMGVGTNIQNRVTALHNVDCPWRPADIMQRQGRAIRQRNQNKEVKLYNYVTERSFDTYRWQTNARKAAFINQVMAGDSTTREFEDVGDATLTAEEAKALASGSPLLMAVANTQRDYHALNRKKTAFTKIQTTLRHTKNNCEDRLPRLRHTITELQTLQQTVVPTEGDAFTMQVDHQGTFFSRTDAASAIQRWAISDTNPSTRGLGPVPLGTLGGIKWELTTSYKVILRKGRSDEHKLSAVIRAVDAHSLQYELPTEVIYSYPSPNHLALNGTKIVRGLERALKQLPKQIASLEEKFQRTLDTLEDTKGRIQDRWPHEAKLAEVTAYMVKLQQLLGTDTTDVDIIDPDVEAFTTTLSTLDVNHQPRNQIRNVANLLFKTLKKEQQEYLGWNTDETTLEPIKNYVNRILSNTGFKSLQCDASKVIEVYLQQHPNSSATVTEPNPARSSIRHTIFRDAPITNPEQLDIEQLTDDILELFQDAYRTHPNWTQETYDTRYRTNLGYADLFERMQHRLEKEKALRVAYTLAYKLLEGERVGQCCKPKPLPASTAQMQPSSEPISAAALRAQQIVAVETPATAPKPTTLPSTNLAHPAAPNKNTGITLD